MVIGGAGHVESLLCPQLLELGHAVVAYDTCFFGRDFLPLSNPRFSLDVGDIRDANRLFATPSRN